VRIDVKDRQRGVSIVFVIIVVVAVAAVFLALSGLFRSSSGVQGSSRTGANLGAAANALEQYASASARLPCPADPGADTGDAVPAAASAACTFPAGTIPWKTIGLRREDAFDAWGGKISYRVYTGANGSLTQAEGASMVKCDTVEPAPAGRTAAGLCKDTHDTTEAQFLLNKGLTVMDFGNTVNGVAYVLVSHGPSGLGGYTGAGVQRTAPGNAGEIANTTAAGPFVAQAAVTTGLAPGNAAFFDDVLAYRKLDDFVQRARLAARDWPEPAPPPADVTVTLDQATAGASSSSSDNLGSPYISAGGSFVVGAKGGSLEDLSFDTLNGVGGIGVAGGTVSGNPLEPNNNLRFMSNVGNESMFIAIGKKERWFAVTLNHFGTYTPISSSLNFTEKFNLIFFDGGNLVGSVVKSACRADGQLASFSIDVPGGIYDGVFIQPQPATEPGGATNQSAFLLSQYAACLDTASSCATPLATTNPTSVCP
jgi:type II secretory pathway pseudopilin PulG